MTMAKNKNQKNTASEAQQKVQSMKDAKNESKNGTSSKNTNTPANIYDTYTK